MRCENCGWENPDSNSKCEKCGTKLVKSSGTVQQSSEREIVNATQHFAGGNTGLNLKGTAKACPKCGYPIRPGDSRCPKCSSEATGEKPAESEAQKSKPVDWKKTHINSPNTGKEGDELKTSTEQPEQADEKVVGFLVTYTHKRHGEFFPVYEGRNFIGSGEDMNIVIKGDNSVSQKHFSILYRAVDGKFKFKDEQSVNGTFINGELTDEGELQNNDIISIGKTKLVLMVIPEIEEK